MQIKVYYRTHHGQNTKARPEWFDRRIALESLRQALARSGVPSTLTFVIDGAMPADLESQSGPQDEHCYIKGGSAAKSLRACLTVAATQARTLPGDTIFWFAEDDYLYRPDAFRSLVGAVRAVPQADYFTLYAPVEESIRDAPASQPYIAPDPLPDGPIRIEQSEWHRVAQTTSTFGVRSDALRADTRLIKLGSTVGGAFDAATWVALQHEAPFPWRSIHRELSGFWGWRGMAKIVARPIARATLNIAAKQPSRAARTLIAPTEHLAVHAEQSFVPAGGGWAELARSLRD